MTGISYKFIRLFFTNGKVDFLYASFIRVSQRIFWKSLCFRCIVRYHGWLSCTNFNNLRYWSESFLIGKFLAVNFLTVRAVDAGLDSSLTFNTRSGDLTGISYKFIRLFFTNREVDFLYAGFVRVGQWILWQGVCFRCITWYHAWFSRSNFNNLCYWR